MVQFAKEAVIETELHAMRNVGQDEEEPVPDEADSVPPPNVPPLSPEWIREAFKLDSNELLSANPKLKQDLIDILARHPTAFKGGASKSQSIGQGCAGRTDWITARVELKDGEQSPVNVRQRPMHPYDLNLLEAQLKLWRSQQMIEPVNSEWNSALLAVSKQDTTAKRFCLDLCH